jgi:hypothetical protein
MEGLIMERTVNTYTDGENVHYVTKTNDIYDTACSKHLDVQEIDMTDSSLEVDCINCILAKGFVSGLHNSGWNGHLEDCLAEMP